MELYDAVPGEGGDVYIPMAERTGEESVVFFTRDLSPAGIAKLYERVNEKIGGKVAIKLHTGEPNGPNFTPSAWVKEFVEAEGLQDATIIETNTAYPGKRYTTADHRETLKVNGWADFTEVDIIDGFEDGTDDNHANIPVPGGKWFDEMNVGAGMLKYETLIALTHFKGHPQGGFGGANKNIGIGCASGHVGKGWIHGEENEEPIMEKITESTAATLNFFDNKVAYVNVMRNMSVDCDCFGVAASPVVTPNVGVLASLDICAIDTACVDLIWAMKDEDNAALKERILSRKGLRQLTYMQEQGMGNMRYKLIDIDNDDAEITPAEAVAHVVPFTYE